MTPEQIRQADRRDRPGRTGRAKRRRATEPAWGGATMLELGLSERQRRIMVISATALAVLVSAVVLTMLVNQLAGVDARASRETLTAGAPLGEARPGDYQGWPSLAQFQPIGDRTADAAPLTEEEVFAAKTVKNGRLTLKLTARRLDTDCAAALWGEELLGQLADSGCTQVLRGLYTSADGRYVAQYTLLNLSDVTAANALVEWLNAGHRSGWVRPLPAGQGTPFPLGGYSESSGHAMGHYVGLVWYGRADGADPTAADDFVTLGLAVRSAEKAVFRRVVAASTPAQ